MSRSNHIASLPDIIGLSSQLIMWKMNSLTSGAELIVSRAELIVCEAKLTVSEAKTVMSEPHLILGVTNIISWYSCRSPSRHRRQPQNSIFRRSPDFQSERNRERHPSPQQWVLTTAS